MNIIMSLTAWPFFETVPATKFLPVAAASTDIVTCRDPSLPLRNISLPPLTRQVRGSYPLKLVIVVVKDPSAAATTGVEVSRFAAMLVFPQAFAPLGLLTSDRLGVPATPRTGAIAACACTCAVNVKARTAAAKTFENISATESYVWK